MDFNLHKLKITGKPKYKKLSEDYDTEIAWYPDVTNQVERHNKRSTRKLTRKYTKIQKKGNKSKGKNKTRKR